MKTPNTVGLNSATKHIAILQKSYRTYFADSLVSTPNPLNEVWHADYVVVSHGIEPDPVFNFGNLAALTLFELSFSQFIQLPSRKSAEEVSQIERSRLLAEVTEHGCIHDYTGIRISATGVRFFIENAKVWNLYDDNTAYYGQAAMFKSWKYL